MRKVSRGGYVQSEFSYGTLATGFDRIYYPSHQCLEKDLKRSEHLNKMLEMQIASSKVEKQLIERVSKWGKSKKLLLCRTCDPKEGDPIDLGIVQQGHWSQRGNTTLAEPELHDFLRKAHATEGIFRMVTKKGIKTVKTLLVGEWKKSDSKQITSQEKKRIIGYNGYVCLRCLRSEILEVYYDGKETTRRRHECDPKMISNVQLLPAQNKEHKIRKLREGIAGLLMTSVKSWAKQTIYAQAVEVQSVNEGYVELDPIMENYWAARVVTGRTTLNDEELLQFLQYARATSSIFKIPVAGHERFYWIVISDIPFEIA